jgi:hypothetical protein
MEKITILMRQKKKSTFNTNNAKIQVKLIRENMILFLKM